MRLPAFALSTALISALALSFAAAALPQEPNDEPEPPEAAQPPVVDIDPPAEVRTQPGDRPATAQSRLWREVNALLDELQELRRELAQVRLERDEAQRELAELRQFIEDHEVYGDDFEQYRGVREITEREQRREQAEAARERREAQRREQQARMEEFRARRQAEREEARRIRQYRDAGFTPLGLDVFVSRMSYHYPTRDLTGRLRYMPEIGWYQRFFRDEEIDFSQMTISGAVLNAADETRHVGVAIAFFDERGVQVGQETIHVSNARPDVPYPFTSTITMTIDRPFTSSTSYVLYADPIDGEEMPLEEYERME